MFVTRAVRVIDLITNLDMSSFEAHSGLTAFINRLEYEVNECRKEQPFVIRVRPSVVKREEGEEELEIDQETSADAVTSSAAGEALEARDIISDGIYLLLFFLMWLFEAEMIPDIFSFPTLDNFFNSVWLRIYLELIFPDT